MAIPPTHHNQLRRMLSLLQGFIGLGALPPGALLILDPSGKRMSMPLDWLKESPFRNYLIPGLVLFSINGLGHVLGALATWRHKRYAGVTASGLGLFLMLWIIVQVRWIRLLSWLQPTYFIFGLLELMGGLYLQRRQVPKFSDKSSSEAGNSFDKAPKLC